MFTCGCVFVIGSGCIEQHGTVQRTLIINQNRESEHRYVIRIAILGQNWETEQNRTHI